MSKSAAVVALACQIVKLRDAARMWKQTALAHREQAELQSANHERKLAEHRASFGARTSADAKIIEGLRQQIETLNREERDAHEPLVDRVVKERVGLLTQVQDQRAELERLRNSARKAYQDGEALRVERDALRAEVAALQERLRASIARGDFAEIEVARLKAQTPKRSHPVKVGEWVKNSDGGFAQVLEVHKDWYLVARGHGWTFAYCEPCDPPGATHAEPDLTQLHAKGKEAWSDVPNATQWVEDMRGNTEASHDTPAGKEAAEAAIQDEIKVGDVVEVVSASGGQTWMADVGSTGKVRRFEVIDSIECVRLQNLPGKRNALGGYVSLCDVRKVPQ